MASPSALYFTIGDEGTDLDVRLFWSFWVLYQPATIPVCFRSFSWSAYRRLPCFQGRFWEPPRPYYWLGHHRAYGLSPVLVACTISPVPGWQTTSTTWLFDRL